MTYFTNVFVNVYDDLKRGLYNYSLYSGDSIEEIHQMIISVFQATYNNMKQDRDYNPKSLDPNLTTSELRDNMQKILDQNVNSHHYSSATIHIGTPQTDIDDGLNHYKDYLHDTQTEPWSSEVRFNSYGDVAKKIRDVFPYCTALSEQYKLKITLDYMLKNSDIKI